MAILGMANMVLFQGFGDALIQVEELDEDRVSTAFWTNMMLAAGMIAVLQIVALCAPALFGAPMLRPVIAAVSKLLQLMLIPYRPSLMRLASCRSRFGRSGSVP